MSCFEVSYASASTLLLQTETQSRVAMPNLNPEPLPTIVSMPLTVSMSQIARGSARRPSHKIANGSDGFERKGSARGVAKSYRKSPYPYEREHARTKRRPSVRLIRDIDIQELTENKAYKPFPSKHARISLDALLNEADLEKQARKCRAEWLKEQASRVETPRPRQHSPEEIRTLGQWLADVLTDTLLYDRDLTEPGRTHLLGELRAELRSLLDSCINPPKSMVFLALYYMRRLFPFPLDLRGCSDLDRAKVIFRAFCIALLLAFKWLDDYSHSIESNIPKSNKEFWKLKRENPKKYRTCWADFLFMTVTEVKNVELAALDTLNWNISVSTSEWFFWLEDLRNHTMSRSHSQVYVNVARLIFTTQEELRWNFPNASSTPSRASALSCSLGTLRRLECAILVGIPIIPWTVSYPESPQKKWVSPTADLRCYEDEIVSQPKQNIGFAPGSSSIWTGSVNETYRTPLRLSPREDHIGAMPHDLTYSTTGATQPLSTLDQHSSPYYSAPLTPVFHDPWPTYNLTVPAHLL
ncbi:hypothetical protein BDP27DRAFT_1414342 [Rhodocollybia butyracea]|uniref:Uncharacterized protein n=1 Tax=Rhodocollybia butyracea TaxID=206335 RepID=A0A9P5Q884_9AGAR|nr:hypothetical protein BDP27DRAFT_1414342 [Rhodocollybia butyracea]